MIIREEQRDLFSVPKSYFLMHCISADCKMGAGIAVEFARRGVKKEILKSTNIIEVGTCKFTNATDWLGEFNLITKEKYYQKPTYETLTAALQDAKNLCIQGFKYEDLEPIKIAMPCIGCGLDRLSWSKVRRIIEQVFQNTDIEILICRRI